MLKPFLEMTDNDLDWVLGPNLLGVVYCIRAAVPWMPPGSRIVNVSSVSGRVPTPGEAFYSAAKAGVVSLSEALESEFHGRGIGVTSVHPGEMSTGLFAEHPSWERRPDFQRRMEIPPEQVARAILRAVERERFEVTVPLQMRLVLLLQRVAPGLFRRGVKRFYRKVLEPLISERAEGGDSVSPRR
jgi:NAD(P)-dependent dehydrogenase (short-subunit alcohol dehydrogenase family)